MDGCPAPVGVVENSSLLESLLVMVTGNIPLAIPFSVVLVVVSSPCATVTLPGTSPTGLTAAVTALAPCAGRLNPPGTLAVTVALPESKAENRKLALWSPPLIVTDDTDTVPTVVLELLTGTVAGEPPRSGCTSAKLKFASSRAANTVMVVPSPWLVEKLGTPIPLGPASTKPDGVKVMVATPLVKLGALAVRAALPLLTRACATGPVTVLIPSLMGNVSVAVPTSPA